MRARARGGTADPRGATSCACRTRGRLFERVLAAPCHDVGGRRDWHRAPLRRVSSSSGRRRPRAERDRNAAPASGTCIAKSSPRELAGRAIQSRGSGICGLRQAQAPSLRARLDLSTGSRTSASIVSGRDAVHERGVRAVFQQPPHQVGQQRFVVATGA
jgi:hypothetical protein